MFTAALTYGELDRNLHAYDEPFSVLLPKEISHSLVET